MSSTADKSSDSTHSHHGSQPAKNGRVKEQTLVSIIIASVLGGGGVSILGPKVVPQWYRPDPATGAELREVKRQVRTLQADFDEFLRRGPRDVRNAQRQILHELQMLREQLKKD